MDKHRKTIPAAWTATPRRPGMRPVPCTHSPIVPPPIRHLASSRQLHASPPSSPRGVALCSCSGWLARSLMFCPRERGRRGGRARKTERKGEREIVGGNGWTRRGVGVPRKRKKESTVVVGVGRERGDEHTSCFPRAARCKRRASRAHLYVQPSLSKGNGISQGVGYNGEEEKRAIATGVVDPWMIAGTTA